MVGRHLPTEDDLCDVNPDSCEPDVGTGDCAGIPCGDGDGGEDAADEATAAEAHLCVRGNVSDFRAISPHTLNFDDNLTGTGDMDGDGNVDTDSSGNPIQYSAEGQARRFENAAGETTRYQTWLNTPLIRSVAAQTGQTVRQRHTDTITHEYVHHVNPTWSEDQVIAEAQDIYDNTTKAACGTEETEDD